MQKLNKILSKLAVALIKGYQKVLSPDHGPLKIFFSKQVCRFHPTCSEYSIEAIEKYGFWKGIKLGMKRISKCHPFNDGGYDPLT